MSPAELIDCSQLRGRTNLGKVIIRKVPTEVCHADIFLDDVKEVTDIVRDEFERLEASKNNASVTQTLEFTYEVDDNYIFSALEELEDHGGKVSQFSLIANIERRFDGGHLDRNTSRLLHMWGTGQVRFETPLGLKSQEWSIFSKVEQIIKARQNRVKTFGDSIPGMIPMLSCCTILFLTFVVFSSLSLKSGYFRPIATVFSVIWILWICFMAILIYSVWRKNFVLLRYSRQNERDREAIRSERWGKLGWILLGAILGALFSTLGQMLFAKLKH